MTGGKPAQPTGYEEDGQSALEGMLSKKLAAWVICVGPVLIFVAGTGQNTFVPSARWISAGTILSVSITALICFFAARHMLQENTPALLAGLATLTVGMILVWQLSRLIVVGLPDIYTRNFGYGATLEVHPTSVINGAKHALQAEISEKPTWLGNIFLYDAPAGIKNHYSAVRGPVYSAPPVTLTGLQSLFGFHKTGFVAPP